MVRLGCGLAPVRRSRGGRVAGYPRRVMRNARVRRATGDVAWLRLNRPDKLNSFTVADVAARCATLGREIQDDDSIRALVVIGNGRAFSSGIDTTRVHRRQRRRRDRARSTTPAHATPTRRSTASCACRRRTRGSRQRGTRRSRRCAATRSAPDCSSRSRATSACSRAARRSACSSTSTGSFPTSAERSGCRASSARARRRR